MCIDDLISLKAGGHPNLFLVLFEVLLLSGFSLEVDVEPHGELSGKYEKIGEPVMIKRGVNDKADFIVVEPNFSLQLIKFGG